MVSDEPIFPSALERIALKLRFHEQIDALVFEEDDFSFSFFIFFKLFIFFIFLIFFKFFLFFIQISFGFKWLTGVIYLSSLPGCVFHQKPAKLFIERLLVWLCR